MIWARATFRFPGPVPCPDGIERSVGDDLPRCSGNGLSRLAVAGFSATVVRIQPIPDDRGGSSCHGRRMHRLTPLPWQCGVIENRCGSNDSTRATSIGRQGRLPRSSGTGRFRLIVTEQRATVLRNRLVLTHRGELSYPHRVRALADTGDVGGGDGETAGCGQSARWTAGARATAALLR